MDSQYYQMNKDDVDSCTIKPQTFLVEVKPGISSRIQSEN